MKKGRPPKKQRRLAGGPPKLSAYNRFVKRFMKGRKGKATANMKAAARAWRAQGKKPRAAPKRGAAPKRRAPAKKGGKSTMGRRSGFNQQKAFKLVRLAALALPAVSRAIQSGVSNEGKLKFILRAYTGYDIAQQKFDLGHLAEGYMPLLGATLATYGIPKIAGLLRGL